MTMVVMLNTCLTSSDGTIAALDVKFYISEATSTARNSNKMVYVFVDEISNHLFLQMAYRESAGTVCYSVLSALHDILWSKLSKATAAALLLQPKTLQRMLFVSNAGRKEEYKKIHDS